MKFGFIILSVFLTLAVPMQEAFAVEKVREGYALANLKELAQTMVGIGSLDIRVPEIADEYARLVYCDLHRKNYVNDIEWGKIRSYIISNVVEKKEYYRVLYEVRGIFNLGRYDFENRVFPLSEETESITGSVMRNVDTIDLILNEEFVSFCGLNSFPDYFLPYVVLKLFHPITVEGFYVPEEDVEGILARMEEAGNKSREVYGRIRVRIIEPVFREGKVWRMEMKGDVETIDFFLDREMTKRIGHVRFTR